MGNLALDSNPRASGGIMIVLGLEACWRHHCYVGILSRSPASFAGRAGEHDGSA